MDVRTRPRDEEITVVALGGNALARAGERDTREEQIRRAREACRSLIPLIASGTRLLITHGNGPQVGNELIRVERARDETPPATMDACVAATQGSMGYLIEQALRNEMARANLQHEVVAVISLVRVDRADLAFQEPTKPVGPFFTRDQAAEMTRTRGWRMAEASGGGFRRVVPSPRPVEVLGIAAIPTLLAAGQIVIAAGGGGIPVTRSAGGEIEGVEAVIDKDYTTSLIARRIGARCLIQLTAVEYAYLDYDRASRRPVAKMSVKTARDHLAAGHFPPGSMGPKVESCCDFVASGGEEALITTTEHLDAALRGETGTRIHPDLRDPGR
jgi:carbamate kinase